ncbi:MAG: response regulator [Nitrospinae bacterium]|nr:response regulator [Nitrospinota bacterium]
MVHDLPILLVEDDVVDVKTVKRAFKENRITNPLYIAGNGEEALAFLRREGQFNNPEAAPRPGIILLDLNMPVMNGIEFLKVVKADEDLKRIPVIVLTTSKEENDRVNSYNLSVAGYIIKPVEFDKFVEAVKTIKLYWSLSLLPDNGGGA